MTTDNDRQIDELIGNALKDNVPADVEQRLRTQLDGFRCGLGEVDNSAVASGESGLGPLSLWERVRVGRVV